ncbi:MAG: mandelate racemase/muconate lactonizing enzyme family protein [Planctomycetes bacterium]|nr:mandelate racemase/muconate lactonizing enzyme family protein [Planctomycetota bacterium]
MKITDVRALGPLAGYTTFVEIETDDGITGIGATDAPVLIVKPILEHGEISLKSLVVGEDPSDPRRLWRKMSVRWPARRGRGCEAGLAVNAMAAIDMALWDLTGKAAGKPVYQLLGDAVQRSVTAYASSTLFTEAPDGAWIKKPASLLVRECRWALQQGFQAIKFGWGNSFGPEDEDRLAAIRAGIGPETRLMLDLGCPAYWGGDWDLKAAIRAARRLEKYDLYFWEEPLPPHDVTGFRKLCNAVRIPIATGESLTTADQFDPFIERQALHVVQPDAQQMGITPFHQVASKAGRAGILCVPHGPWTAMAVAAHLHLLATLKNGDMIEYPNLKSLGWCPRTRDEVRLNNREIVEYPPVLKDGCLPLPERPGLGLGGFVHKAIRKLDRFYPSRKQ